MTTARTFNLLEDINLNVGNKNINKMKGYSRAPDLESNKKNLKFQETLRKSSKVMQLVGGQLGNMFLSYFPLKLFHS